MAKSLNELRAELQVQLALLEAEEAAVYKRKANEFKKVFMKIAVRAARNSTIGSVHIEGNLGEKMRFDLTKLFRKYARDQGNCIVESNAMSDTVSVVKSIGEGT